MVGRQSIMNKAIDVAIVVFFGGLVVLHELAARARR